MYFNVKPTIGTSPVFTYILAKNYSLFLFLITVAASWSLQVGIPRCGYGTVQNVDAF